MLFSEILDIIIPLKGSASLKYVYPAVVGKDYSHLIIQNGEEAFHPILQ